MPKNRPFPAVAKVPSGVWQYQCEWTDWNTKYAATIPPPLITERALLQRPAKEKQGLGSLLPCERLRRFVLTVMRPDDVVLEAPDLLDLTNHDPYEWLRQRAREYAPPAACGGVFLIIS